MVGAVKLNMPAGEEVPPVRLALAKVCPKVMVSAVGGERMVEAALATERVLVAEPSWLESLTVATTV